MSWCRPWLQGLLSEPSPVWVENAWTSVTCLEAGGHQFPITVNDAEWESSYVCSPYTAFVSYATEELAKLKSPPLESGLRLLIAALGALLRRGRINRVVHVNNWLLSTNLYPNWDGSIGLAELHARLRDDYPDHTLLFRSLNRGTNEALMGRLQALGYRLIPSRQVYLFDCRQGAFRDTKNYRWDRQLLREKTPYALVPHGQFREGDFPRVVELYNLLYLKKYSQHNPHFSTRLVALWHRHRHLTLWGLRLPGGRLDGVVGILERDGVTTVPLVGYDTGLPQQLGLYRMLMALSIGDAVERRRLLNLSAGASHFKRIRGGVPALEYSAAYYRHLPLERRLVWSVLDRALCWIAAPLMRRLKL